MSQRLKADLVLLMVAVIWGSAFVAQRVSGLAGIVHLFNGARFLLASLILIPFVPKKVWQNKEQFRWMAIAGAVLFIASALQQAGLQFTTAGNAGFLTTLYVVFVPLLSYVFWKEKPHRVTWLAIPLALLGAYLLSTGGEFHLLPGDSLEIIGALFWAMHVLILGKFANRFHPLAFAIGQFLVASFLSIVAGFLVSEQPSILLQTDVFWALIYVSVFSVAVGYTLQVWAQHHTPPADAALLLSLEAVFAVLTGWSLLGESLLIPQIVGCVLIFAAVLLAQLREFFPNKIT